MAVRILTDTGFENVNGSNQGENMLMDLGIYNSRQLECTGILKQQCLIETTKYMFVIIYFTSNIFIAF